MARYLVSNYDCLFVCEKCINLYIRGPPLRFLSFSEEVLTALKLLTHDQSVPYMDYVAALSDNEIARSVKIADLKHNSDLSRLDIIVCFKKK